MKRLIIIPFVFISLLAVGQNFSVGPRIGYSSGNMSRNESGKVGVQSLLAGAAFNFSFNDLFSLQLEAYYLKKGGGYGFKLNGVTYSDHITFNLVEFPLLARFTIGSTKAKLLLLGGSYFGYVISGKWIYQDDVDKVITDLNFSFYDVNGMKAKRIDFGMQFGGGMTVELGRGKLVTELRYGLGLSEWFKFNSNSFYSLSLKNLNHRTFAISASYLYPLWSRI
jgi:hypothetical protein